MLLVKRIYVDSKYKTADSNSDSNFNFQLPQTCYMPPMAPTWKNTPRGFACSLLGAPNMFLGTSARHCNSKLHTFSFWMQFN